MAGELAGHEVDAVVRIGWGGVQNGELLRRAAGEYDVFLTIDQALQRQQVIPPNLAVLTLDVRTNRIEGLLPLVPDVLKALDQIRPGESIRIGRQASG